MGRALLLALACLAAARGAAAQPTSPPDSIEKLVARLEQALAAGDRDAIMSLGTVDASSLDAFAEAAGDKPTRVVVKERDRRPLEDGGQRLLIEVFAEQGSEARLAPWELDLMPAGGRGARAKNAIEWRVIRAERLTLVSGLYRLALNTTKQYDVRNLVVTGTDFAIEMQSGSAFVAETGEGPTAIVLVGRGRMRFTPPDESERSQVRIFSGADALASEFDGAFIRIKPVEFTTRFPAQSMVQRDAQPADLKRASEIFEEFIGRTFQLDLTDLSRERWSLVPPSGDLIAEVRTRQFGNLTYARSGSEAEDVTLFDRRRRRNISVYASAAKLAARGRFYSEDDLADYDMLDYEIESTFSPERLFINGNAKLRLRVRSPVMTTLTLRLAEALTVRGVYSPEMGRLLHLRVVGQNSLIVNLPAVVQRDTELVLTILYSGRLEPQEVDREGIDVQQQERESAAMPLELRWVYSNNSYWYPQSTVTDYSLAKLRITVPQEFDVVASGVSSGPASPAPGPVGGAPRQKTFVFATDRPVRYLTCAISRFTPVLSTKLKIRTSPKPEADPLAGSAEPPAPAAATDGNEDSVALVVQANPRQTGRARSIAEQASSIMQFYASIIGEAPYPSLTLAVTENDLPGGHSPAYLALVNQTLPTTPVVWRNDPVNFENFPSFFVAHELAHQWWGQAVGWKNYHEQWLSEGFAQYFATLWAEKERGRDGMAAVLRQMRRWGIDTSPQGPIYLGYRLGHIKGDSRVRRSILYNKAAVVLHMLRRLVGDDPFYWGLRRFYAEWRFKKAGTDDFRVAMEATTGRDLSPFFDAWIYGAAIPRLRFSYTANDKSVSVKFEHLDAVIQVPVTVTITYASGETEDIVVPVTERVAERTIPLKGVLRKVEANDDGGALAEIEK